ncbi:MAG: hypothetical protein MRY49_01245 [Candidatus Pacebacteria bacterium]|nr:hypothetical protein [Candidatus Paceibacterota bacterium]
MDKTNNKITFKPKQVTKNLIAVLNDRAKDVIISRYGLGKDTERLTLEAIGQKYGITRERVRQIENHSLNQIRKSEAYDKETSVFDDLKSYIDDLGAIVSEEDLLETIAKDDSTRNHIHFLLVLGHHFMKDKEDDNFAHRWYVDKEVADEIHGVLDKVYKNLSDDDIIPESEMISDFLDYVKDVSDKHRDEEVVKRWLRLSKKIGRNDLDEWGRSTSPNINVKGIRDYAFLVIRRHGSPIHFREVAKSINEIFNKKAHEATTHNELIKDPRFVLVGRGLYALTEWGYTSGVVKDVIKEILEKNGPLTKDEVIEKVLKERYVKENTIMVNLQNPNYFKKTKEGKYTLA